MLFITVASDDEDEEDGDYIAKRLHQENVTNTEKFFRYSSSVNVD
jgi:hypothetical protein